jgi:hypothetical protein
MYYQKKLFTSHQELPSHGGTSTQIEEQLTKDIAEELKCQAVNTSVKSTSETWSSSENKMPK